jgi:hypothetical protein
MSWSHSSVSDRQIATELLRRRRATESLIAFTEYTFERYRTASHHTKIAEALEMIADGVRMCAQPPLHDCLEPG